MAFRLPDDLDLRQRQYQAAVAKVRPHIEPSSGPSGPAVSESDTSSGTVPDIGTKDEEMESQPACVHAEAQYTRHEMMTDMIDLALRLATDAQVNHEYDHRRHM